MADVATPPTTVARTDLYNDVWSVPTRKLAERFGVAPSDLRRVCRQFDIPVPDGGYWRKKRNGLTVRRKPLPSWEDGQEPLVSVEESSAATEGSSPNPDDVAPEIAALIQKERDPANKITVSDQLRSPLALIRATRDAFRDSRIGMYGRVMPSPRVSDTLRFDVTEPLVARCLLIMDALLKALAARGHRVGFKRGSRDHLNVVNILGQDFSFLLREPVRRIEIPTRYEHLPEYEYEGRGLLQLHVYRGDGWGPMFRVNDTQRTRLEDRLNEVVVKLLRAVDDERKRAVLRAKRAEEEAERERLRREERRRERLEEIRRRSLEESSVAWEQAERVRQFIKAVREETDRRDQSVDEDVARWIAWAEDYLAGIDPIGPNRALPRFSDAESQVDYEIKRNPLRDRDTAWIRPTQPR